MKKAADEGHTRTLAEHLSPSNKVISPAVQQHSLPLFTFPQETPMKPPQVPNLLPHSSPRRYLPLQSQEQSIKDIFSSQWHPTHPTEPGYPSGITPNSPVCFDFPHFAQPPGSVPINPTSTSAYVPQFTAREQLGPQHNNVQPGPGHFSSSQLVPTSPTRIHTSCDRPLFPSMFSSPSSKSERNPSSYSTPSHSRNDQKTESKVTSSSLGNNIEKTQRQEHLKSQQDESTAFHKNLVPAVDLNCTSQKRCRELQDCYENSKKQCLWDSDSARAQTDKPVPCTSPSTLFVSQQSSENLEISPKTPESYLLSDLAHGQAASSELLPSFKPAQSHTTSQVHCPNKASRMETKQEWTTVSQNLGELSLSSRSCDKGAKKGYEDNHKNDKLGPNKGPQKDRSRSPHVGPVSHGHSTCRAPVVSAKTPDRGNHMGESRKLGSNSHKSSPKPNLGSSNGHRAKPRKTNRGRRPVVPDDIDQLFTPDPIYVVTPVYKTAKPKTNEETIKSSISEKGSSPAPGCVPPVTASSCQMTPYSKVTESPHAVSSSACNSLVSLPTVALKRVKLEKLQISSEEKGPKKTPALCSENWPKGEIKSHHKKSPLGSTNTSSHALEPDKTSSHHHIQSISQERQASEESLNKVNEEDPIDVELDLGLSIAYDLSLTQNSDSSEEEQLVSFQEIMERVTKPPDTPEKGTFSEPNTPGRHSSQPKTHSIYKNTLDQMLKEINDNKRAKETETQLLTACKEDLSRLAEYEQSEDGQEVVSSEQQEFLQRYSLMSTAIREVPPGETVFDLERFGQIFDQNTLQLRQCMVNPQGTTQKTLLWSSPAQLKLHLNIGLFQEAYNCNSPCPTQVTRFLFKMMSIHNERMVSEKILEALCDIACSAAHQIVKNRSQQFEVWVPSLADVTLVLMNMGASFVTLFPFDDLQPTFTEGDLLDEIYIKSEISSNNKEERIFPEHNCTNIIKYLSYCMGLCPRAYSDEELLLLLTIVGKISLETQWILQSRMEVICLQYKIINNIRDWNTMLPRICQAFTGLTDDHHNMCLLVQLLPDSSRGKALSRHLSMCLISKLLDGTCTYRPSEEEFPLVELRPYIPRMQPSKLLRGLLQKYSEKNMVVLDQQAYYLCYSLLMLMNEASNLPIFKSHQKKELLVLSAELDTHVKSDIRESEKCLYRSKVKDLLARIYTKWHILLQRTRPLYDKLYDYWQPVDTLMSSQEDEEGTVTEVEDEEEGQEEEEDDITENDDIMDAENKE